jgi:predicted regulator of Ras-like GTPase activity (Roadblock/LC7/MglB family)/tetratricopeptide (TPR) repeat protein
MALFGGPSTPVSRLEELKRLLQKDPTSRQFLALAEEYRRHGKYRDAVITLERGLQMHSTSVAAYVALGKTYQQLDRLEDAIRAFTNALRIDRENLVAIRQLAEVYLARGDKVEAIKKLKLYRGLKAGDRDVTEIIQRLEEEMSAAVAERPRSGVHPAHSEHPEHPETPRPAPYASGVRRVAMIPRLERFPASLPATPIPPRERAPDIMAMTYDGGALSRAIKAARSGPVTAPESPFLVPPPEPPEPPSPPALPPFTAPIASIPEEPVAEIAPFALGEAGQEDDVPEEAATAPFTFPVDLYRTEARARPSTPVGMPVEMPVPVETAPFDVLDEPPEAPPAGRAAPHVPSAPSVPLVTETLGDLYRAQGHMADARETYRTLAEAAADEERARALREKAAALPRGERTDHPSLRRLARRFPKRMEVTVDDLHGLIGGLVEGTEGIHAATLTDREGLPVVMAGASSRDAAMEILVAELSSFLKNVRRTTSETGAGELESFAVAGPHGGAVVSRVNADYSLILQVDPDAALGEIRWEAARTARALRPAVR